MGSDPGSSREDQLEAILEAVYVSFGGDRDKVRDWLNTPHPDLQQSKPIDLIRHNRMQELMEVVKPMLDQEQGR